MLFGTRKLSVLSVAPTNSTAENQRLKVSGLTWGFSAADNFCQSWLHFSSIGDLLTVLHNRHTGGCTRDSELGPNETFPERRIRSKHQHLLYVLDLTGLRAYSFSGINLSQTCSHLIHRCLPFLPAAGLRLEIGSDSDKKKSELYFSFSVKKILTEKPKRACP